MSISDRGLDPGVHYMVDTMPAPGDTQEVAPGVHWLRMPLPFALDHINLWLLEDGDGWTIVDSGLASDDCRRLWDEIFAKRLGGKPVTRLIVTHFHPDHLGFAGWLTARWDVPLHITLGEWLYGRMLSLDTGDDMIDGQVEFYRRAGCDDDYLAAVRERGAVYAKRVSAIPRTIERLRDGDEIAIGGRTWRIVVGRGHAPEHACLHCPELDLMISGDQVLPKISPNVGVYPTEPEGEPLSDFLDTLRAFKALPASTLVLPAHNYPFRGLHPRLDSLAAHHEARCDDLLADLDGPKTTMQLAKVLFRRPLDVHQTGFAVGETLAHLHLLRRRGLIAREDHADGAHRFRRTAAGEAAARAGAAAE